MTNTADLLEQIPDLGEDVQDPEDCFTEGIALGGSLPQSQLCLDGQEDQQLLGTQGLVAPHPDPAACLPSLPPSFLGALWAPPPRPESWRVCPGCWAGQL